MIQRNVELLGKEFGVDAMGKDVKIQIEVDQPGDLDHVLMTETIEIGVITASRENNGVIREDHRKIAVVRHLRPKDRDTLILDRRQTELKRKKIERKMK